MIGNHKYYILDLFSQNMEEYQISEKLNKIEEDVNKLKILLALHMHKKKKKIASLKGILWGVEINDNEIEEAKKSLFKEK